MLNRLVAVLITLFWVTMWALLIRTEVAPEGAALREVPVEHVLKLMFQHQQPSSLFIRGEGRLLGRVTVQPRVLEDQRRTLDVAGNLQLRLPGTPRQRFSWRTESLLTPALTLDRLHGEFTIHQFARSQTPDVKMTVDYTRTTNLVRYTVREGSSVLERREFPATEAGVRSVVEQLGLDPGVIATLQKTSAAPAKVTAHRSDLRVKDEMIETLLVSVEYNEQTMLQMQLSQLGQILHAKTVLGWTFEAE